MVVQSGEDDCWNGVESVLFVQAKGRTGGVVEE